MGGYLLNVLIGIDQFGNCLLAGYPDETISARAWRRRNAARRWALMRVLIDAMFRCFGQSNHCRDAYESEALRRQQAPEFRPGG